MDVRGILHVGAHDCEEMEEYNKNGCSKIVWVEGNPKLVEKIKKRDPTINIKNYLVSDVDDTDITFHIANNGQSSSILELGTHANYYRDITYIDHIQCRTKRIDTMYEIENVPRNFANFLNVDVQGAELLVLKSMGTLLNEFDYLYLEVNSEHVYKECCLVDEIDEYVKPFGFVRVDTRWTGQRWGDAFYLKVGPVL